MFCALVTTSPFFCSLIIFGTLGCRFRAFTGHWMPCVRLHFLHWPVCLKFIMSSNLNLFATQFQHSMSCMYRNNHKLLNQYGLKYLLMLISSFIFIFILPFFWFKQLLVCAISCLSSYVHLRSINPFFSFLDCKMNLSLLHTWRCYMIKLLSITELADLLIFLVVCTWIPGCPEGTGTGGQFNCFWINMLRKFRVVMPASKVKLLRMVIYRLICLIRLVRVHPVLVFAFEMGLVYFLKYIAYCSELSWIDLVLVAKC